MFNISIALQINMLMSTPEKYLTQSPFLIMLEYGGNKDVYWTGNHMFFSSKTAYIAYECCADTGMNFVPF